MSGHSKELLEKVASPLEFEDFVINLVNNSGEFEVERTSLHGDIGIDAIGKRKCADGVYRPVILEIKYTGINRRITISSAVQLNDALLRKGDKEVSAILVTNTYPDLETRKFCLDHGIEVWDKDVLVDLIGRTFSDAHTMETVSN
jgi:hypothetical protein